MPQYMNEPAVSPSTLWRERIRRIPVLAKRAVPFVSGVLATLVALLLYSALTPEKPQLTEAQVSTSVAQAIASITPAPAPSALVYQVIQPSLVLIQAQGLDVEGENNFGLGTGVIISDAGEILTSLHIVENALTIQVTFADGTQANAQIIAAEPEIDIAVLATDQLPEIVVPAVLGNPNALRVGDEAYVVGNPFGLYSSMSSGVISGFNRSFQDSDGVRTLEGLIQFDTAVNPGNSGGPLLNRAGQVVGIVTALLNPTEEEVFIGIGFAVPITTAGGAAGAPQY
jgi:S1-C subfamily serine protease